MSTRESPGKAAGTAVRHMGGAMHFAVATQAVVTKAVATQAVVLREKAVARPARRLAASGGAPC